MNRTTDFHKNVTEKMLLDTTELQAILSCGRASAVKIGAEANARVAVGRRVFWNQQKIQLYLNRIAE